METFSGNYKRTKTTDFFMRFNKFLFLFGLPNYWVEDLNYPILFTKIYTQFNKIGMVFVCTLIVSEYGAFFTQKKLNDKQTSDLLLFSIAHSITAFFSIRISNYVPEIREVMYILGIQLKEIHNDVEVEDQMIKKTKFFSMALALNCILAVSMMTFEALMKTLQLGETFTTVITVFPDISDSSTFSNIIRAFYNIFWWINLSRVISVYSLVISLTSAMSFQFKNLNSYFCSLSYIFEDINLQQEEKEKKYEAGVKIGIKLHVETLKCTDQIQMICRDVFSGQIIFNLLLLIVLMYQMVNSNRNVANVLTIAMAAASILLSTGFFMWNAGDITVEAEGLPTSIFSSGWENCHTTCSTRVRKLIVISMIRAQQPVVLTGFGIIGLSYQSYVSIVKSSYSVFSVVY